MAEQRCRLCNRQQLVVMDGRGFPPDMAKRLLVKRCKDNGCPCDPTYTATVVLGPRPCGQ